MAIENSNAAVMKPSSIPAFLTTTRRAKRRADTAMAARMVMAKVTAVTAEPGAWPDIAMVVSVAHRQQQLTEEKYSEEVTLYLKGFHEVSDAVARQRSPWRRGGDVIACMVPRYDWAIVVATVKLRASRMSSYSLVISSATSFQSAVAA